jgi:hypothetical protein
MFNTIRYRLFVAKQPRLFSSLARFPLIAEVASAWQTRDGHYSDGHVIQTVLCGITRTSSGKRCGKPWKRY